MIMDGDAQRQMGGQVECAVDLINGINFYPDQPAHAGPPGTCNDLLTRPGWTFRNNAIRRDFPPLVEGGRLCQQSPHCVSR